MGTFPTPTSLADRFHGGLLGGAIGDAMGAPTEWRSPEEIRARYGGPITDFAPPFLSPQETERVKGNGHVTDDTLMTLALCRAFLSKGDHLDAYDMATYLLDELAEQPVWVPEWGREMLLLDRLFYPEKYLFLRLRLANAEPRQGGIGNMVNCGAAMYAAPVGLMNAGDPKNAYRRAIDMFSAHQESYGLEAAGLMAAAIAAAAQPAATVETIVETVISLAKDGSRRAIVALTGAAREVPPPDVPAYLRAVMEPFETVKGNVADYKRIGHYPSREHAIEELPVALAYLVMNQGDFRQVVLGAANYGRDADSIAGMAGAICGALHGLSALP
ncbi:MAG: ADP-ribosylglycohydrolase family protein, partial [Ardenticatenaceae bacterium]